MRRPGIQGAVLLLPLSLLAACGTSASSSFSETTTYRCALGRSFQVTVRTGDPKVALDANRNRLLLARPTVEGDEGKSRSAEKTATLTGQYTNGAVGLVLDGEQATVENLPGGPYDNCQAAGPADRRASDAPPLKVE
ncbi:hypothetical protein EDC65_4199 [Stella humosa]|uniref:Membrane-bound lysozyme inhibitor of c-type lysozyme MliC n=1 Tax=Stella humosa TaxID=94 RepID=A0A3N1KSI9_9PROT|nr:hypothetical protein [Stella humosa]ROP83551.1 hypothetical protein EDC65_4199 [Stella humosa]BBK33176.1 hypothetical protein STHU_38100 [Stella humosa]